MRIITGSAKGINLIAGNNTVPLSDRAKSGLFAIISEKIPDSSILDLYAGSGALGLEAISRGAKEADFVDIDRNAIESIRQNAQKTHFQDRCELFKEKSERFIEETNRKYDIVFVFQPYDKFSWHVIKESTHLLNPYGLLVFEHHKRNITKELENLKKIDERKYGIVVIEIYQKIET